VRPPASSRTRPPRRLRLGQFPITSGKHEAAIESEDLACDPARPGFARATIQATGGLDGTGGDGVGPHALRGRVPRPTARQLLLRNFPRAFRKKKRLPVALSVLVNRVVSSGYVRNAAAPELVDVLFALTSFSFFAELTAGGRPVEIVCRIIQNLSADAVDDGLEGERITIASLLLFGGQVAHPLLSVFNNEEA
jgi:hypothetical protein